MLRLTTVLLAAAVWLLAPYSSVRAQTANDVAATAEKPERNVLVGLTPAGVQRQVAGRWATLAVNGTNKTDQDTEETSVVMIGDGGDFQFARRVWIPAGARRQAWLPIQIPDELYPDQMQIKMTSIHLHESEEGESFQASAIGTPTSTRSLLLSWEDSRAAAVIDSLRPTTEEFEQAAVLSKTIYIGRDSTLPNAMLPDAMLPDAQESDAQELRVQDLGMAQLTGQFLPPTAKPLDSLDQIVIANDRMLNDTVGVTRLRAWLRSGGRVWIMVDQLKPESVRALLGDAICYSIVDRVELNEYGIEQIAQHSSASNLSESWSSETPVELVRVLIDTEDVQAQVDGWPAAFWLQVGHGEVLFTTLAAPGWIRGDEPTSALRAMSSRFFVRRLDPPKHSKELATYLRKEIGYQIPGRGLIATILGGHLLLVLAAGTWLARRKELQWMGALIPISAVLAAGILVMAGNQETAAVPSTIATGQLVRAGLDSSEVQVESVAAVYSQETRPLPIESASESITLLGDEGTSGEMKRVLWDDSGESKWMFVTQRQGKVQHVQTASTVTLPKAWSVRGRFTPTGFQGEVSGLDESRFEDAVVVSAASPSLSVKLDDGTRMFESGIENVLLPDQYLDASLISDAQQDRQSLIRELHEQDPGLFDPMPSLLFWTDPIDAGTLFPEGFVRRGWALVTAPIRLERLPAGAKFQVPASFVQLDSYVGSRGPSTIFNPDTGQWLELMNKPSQTDLRCLVPSVLLPCELERAQIVMKALAPGRTVEIKGMIDGQFQTLYQVDSPAGKIDFDVMDSAALDLDDEGGFLLSIAVSATEQEREEQQQPSQSDPPGSGGRGNVSRSTWGIDYVHVSFEGTAL